ncbi:MAG: hypothetical protein KDA79_01290 [Planctomycetaceae bacterium]|nr:hypothetical protein [Planctomycetaceae bacterium]
MTTESDAGCTLADQILNQLETLLQNASDATEPLELEPWRSRLFELFVTAEGAGYVSEEAEADLTADGLCRSLSARWGLTEAARESASRQEKLAPQHVGQMRLLWSVMRMWMEWTYAWSRWSEFHTSE